MWWWIVGVSMAFMFGFFIAALMAAGAREDAWHDGYYAGKLERRVQGAKAAEE